MTLDLEQRDYEGKPESEYPEWLAGIMNQLYPKVKQHGSVFLNFGSVISAGRYSLYVFRTAMTILRETKWILCDVFIRYKPDGSLGSENRGRKCYEYIVWFGKVKEPYNRF